MSNIETLLAQCRELGATFTPGPGDRLKIKAPAPLPEELWEELRQHKAEVLTALKAQHHPSCSCGHTEGVWKINEKTCWARWACRECEGKVTMPAAHLCDPSLPLTAPCRGGEAPSWLCPRCEAAVEIEATEEVNGRVLTFWRCPKGCTVGVTPATVRIPPVMVPRVRQ